MGRRLDKAKAPRKKSNERIRICLIPKMIDTRLEIVHECCYVILMLGRNPFTVNPPSTQITCPVM